MSPYPAELEEHVRLADGLEVFLRPIRPEDGELLLPKDYDPAKKEQAYQMEESEKAKPLFRVSVTNREAW